MTLQPALRIYRGPDYAQLIILRYQLKPATLQWAHLHHVMHKPVEQRYIQEACVRPRQIERARPRHMYRGCRRSCQGSVCPRHKLHAPLVTSLRIRKYLFRLHIQEPQPHRAVTKESFKVPHAAASAKSLLRIERYHGMAAFPDSFTPRKSSVSDTIANCPDTIQLVQHAARCRNPSGRSICIVENPHGNLPAIFCK